MLYLHSVGLTQVSDSHTTTRSLGSGAACERLLVPYASPRIAVGIHRELVFEVPIANTRETKK